MAEPLPAKIWQFPLGQERTVRISFYGGLPTKESVAVLLEYLDLMKRATRPAASTAADAAPPHTPHPGKW